MAGYGINFGAEMQPNSLAGEREGEKARPTDARFTMLRPLREPFSPSRRHKAHGAGSLPITK